MSVLDKLEHVSDKYLDLAENHYVNAFIALLLMFTVYEEVALSLSSGLEDIMTKAEHGLFFLYLNLLIVSMSRLCKAYVVHRNSKRET